MILGAEIGILIYGLYVLVTGKYIVGRGREIIGGKARILGALCLLPIPTSLIVGFILGFVYGLLTGAIPNPWLSTIIELIILVAYIIAIFFLGKTFYNQQEAQQTQESEYQYDYGPYTNLDSDQFESDAYGGQTDDTSEAYLTSLEEQSSQKEIMGLSLVEIVIIGILVIAICVFGGFVGMDFLKNRAAAMVTVQPTATLVPTVTPTPTITPMVTATPLPGWSQFKFADDKASIWLPSSYQGGDTEAYSDIVKMTIDTFLTDEAFITNAKEMINEQDITLFAFDTELAEVIRYMSVYREELPPYVEFRMKGYLDATVEQMESDGFQIIEQYMTDLNYYSDVGVIIFENTITTGERPEVNDKFAFHFIKVDNDVWRIMFRTGGEEFDAYLPTIETSVRSFYVEP